MTVFRLNEMKPGLGRFILQYPKVIFNKKLLIPFLKIATTIVKIS
jgi:hypothetical protein